MARPWRDLLTRRPHLPQLPQLPHLPRARRLRVPLAAVAVLSLAAGPLQAAAAAPAADVPWVDDPASLVNPIIGTSGAVDTFPGPDVPFGMLQWGPDTTPNRPSGGGYEYNDKKISGYSLTHISGPGCPAAGDVPVLPVAGSLTGDLSATSTGFSHANERSEAGYYRLTDDAGITTELTSTTRAGLATFTFPGSTDSHLLLKLSGGATQIDNTRAQVVNDHEVSGAVTSGHFCGADNTYTLHFRMTFDRPFTSSGTWVGGTVNPQAKSLRLGAPEQSPTSPATRGPQKERHFTVPARPGPRAGHGPAASAAKGSESAAPSAAPGSGTRAKPPVTGANGMYLTFDTTTRKAVTAKVAISYTSDANAAKNLTSEIPGWNFAKVRQAGHDAWNKVLGRVRIGGGSHDQQVQFYTALYHSLLHPNVFSDANGEYAGMDGEIHTVRKGHAQYANYSGWDTYRSQTQLMAVVAPDVTSDVVTSMVNGFDQTGLFPKWAQNNGESYVMVGDPAAGIIAGAYAFGARDFDAKDALDDLVHQATTPNNDRPGQAVRDAKGYLPIDGANWGCCNFYGPVSTQLEYDSADYAIAALAKSLGKDGVHRTFATRAQDWQNVFNVRTGYVQARNASGAYATGFSPGTSNGFVEGTSAQYTPMIPFNLKALIAARGGADAYDAYLDSLLSDIAHPGGTNADLSNEPSVEIPWEYSYLGKPWKTQAAVREAQQKLYFNAPVGQFGNDDLGAMSSWYVWSELGMYPQTPGTDTLVLGSPVFPKAQIRLGGGRTVRINAPQAATDAPYVQSLRVDGSAHDDAWLPFSDLSDGATLDFTLGTSPNTAWASAPSAAPPSDATGQRTVLAGSGPSGAGLVLAPGGSGSGTLDLVNIGAKEEVVRWTAQVPSGVSMDTTSGSLTLGAGAKTAHPVTVTGGGAEGTYDIVFSLSTASGTDLGTTVLHVAVAEPGALWPYYTNEGVHPDGSQYNGGFDGGGWAYSKEALAAAGVQGGSTVTADGITYTWPRTTAGQPDNIETSGQTVPLAAPAGTASVGLLGSATNASSAGATGTFTVTYADGSTAQIRSGFSDWTLGGGGGKPIPGNTTAVTTAYRNTGSGKQDKVATYVFAVKLPVDAAKRVASITLPATADGTAHVFAFGYGS
ncbi:lectin [Streptomyces sp. NPDC046977]|uniref:GH92 family glycosyl hydrolase n=1 Tax=Streptomyces sp. NPDC046977 TaxID=3154703 RepID=UPI0034072B20